MSLFPDLSLTSYEMGMIQGTPLPQNVGKNNTFMEHSLRAKHFRNMAGSLILSSQEKIK